MDLKDLTTNEDEGTLVTVRDQYGAVADPPVTILVAGTYSKAYRKAVDAQRNRMLRQRRTQLTAEQLTQQQAELAAACVLEWNGFTADGKPFPLTKDNAIALFEKAPWIREQVEEAMQDHASFANAQRPAEEER